MWNRKNPTLSPVEVLLNSEPHLHWGWFIFHIFLSQPCNSVEAIQKLFGDPFLEQKYDCRALLALLSHSLSSLIIVKELYKNTFVLFSRLNIRRGMYSLLLFYHVFKLKVSLISNFSQAKFGKRNRCKQPWHVISELQIFTSIYWSVNGMSAIVTFYISLMKHECRNH